MKQIKSISFILILLISGNLLAQPPKGAHQGSPDIPSQKQIEKMVGSLADEIDLSKSQQTIILELYEAHFDMVQTKMSGNSLPDRNEMDDLKVEFENQVKAELTTEQISLYEIFLKKHNKQRLRK